MNKAKGWLVVVGGLVAFYFYLKSQSKEIVKTTLDERVGDYKHIFDKYAVIYELDPALLIGIATVESDMNARAIANEGTTGPGRKDSIPPGHKMRSIGLMQILYIGNNEPLNHFNIAGWPVASVEELMDPDTNIMLGAQILAWNIKTYGLERGISVYNCWSCREGEIKNRSYVDKVLKEYYSRKYENTPELYLEVR